MKTTLLLLILLSSVQCNPWSWTWNTAGYINFSKGLAPGIHLNGVPLLLNQGCQVAAWNAPKNLYELVMIRLPPVIDSTATIPDYLLFAAEASFAAFDQFSVLFGCVFNPPTYGYRTDKPRVYYLL